MNRFKNVSFGDNSVRLRKAHLQSVIDNLEDRLLDCTDKTEIDAINIVVNVLKNDLIKLNPEV